MGYAGAAMGTWGNTYVNMGVGRNFLGKLNVEGGAKAETSDTSGVGSGGGCRGALPAIPTVSERGLLSLFCR